MDRLAILILAAGEARRMGRPKQLLSYKHGTLLGHAIQEALHADAAQVYCVLGAHFEKIKNTVPEEVEVIQNLGWGKGMGSSIAIAIKHIQKTACDGILIMLADQPFVDRNALNHLITCAKAYPQMMTASDYGAKNGVPALFPRFFFENLMSLESDAGARNLLNSNNWEIQRIPMTDKLQDIDTPEDYTRLLKN